MAVCVWLCMWWAFIGKQTKPQRTPMLSPPPFAPFSLLPSSPAASALLPWPQHGPTRPSPHAVPTWPAAMTGGEQGGWHKGDGYSD